MKVSGDNKSDLSVSLIKNKQEYDLDLPLEGVDLELVDLPPLELEVPLVEEVTTLEVVPTDPVVNVEREVVI